jgi:Helicase HerA, central domain
VPALPPSGRPFGGSGDPRYSRRPPTPEPAAYPPLTGRLRLSLSFPARPPVARRQVSAALEGLSRSAAGPGVRFTAPSGGAWRLLTGAPGVVLTVEEWERFWPRPSCLAPGRRRMAGGALPLGRVSSGVVVELPVEIDQGRHLAVLGETGMGKSSLLVALARRAVALGGGVFFDPLGDTVRALRAELPPGLRERTVWVGPEDGTWRVNALEGIGAGSHGDAMRSERRLNDLVHALRRVRAGRFEASSYWGPRIEEMVTRALRAAAAFPRGTMVDAHTLLETAGRLGHPLPPEAGEPVRELMDRIRERPEDRDGARRLLHEVARSPVLVRMLCEPEPTHSTRDLVAPGRLVLLSGDAGQVGEGTARYLLSVYLALVWSELLAREGNPKTFVVLDEAHLFAHESLAEMLQLGRRRNVHVVLATQAIASLAPPVADSVWTNVSDFVAFRGSPAEAREFARASAGVAPEAILALPRGSAAVLLGKGHEVRWVRTARRPSWGHRPAVDPPAPTEEARGPEPPAERPPDPALPVLVELARRTARLPSGAPLEVALDELRREVDPRGEAVRRAGTLLGRLGLLSRVEHGDEGPRWVIEPAGFSELRAQAGLTSPEDSHAPQPS